MKIVNKEKYIRIKVWNLCIFKKYLDLIKLR